RQPTGTRHPRPSGRRRHPLGTDRSRAHPRPRGCADRRRGGRRTGRGSSGVVMPGYRRVMQNGSERTRPRSADIRPVAVRAAAAECAEKGYASATVTDIADRAEVAPSVLYRHFSGKGDMFKDAVVSPLLDALEEYRVEWASQRSRPYPDEQIWL